MNSGVIWFLSIVQIGMLDASILVWLIFELPIIIFACGVSGSLRFREIGSLGIQEFWNSGVREFGISGVREFGSLGVWEFGSVRVLES